ncbi:MAG: hypothetical protein ABSE49_19115 [Polyangiaceae bacterium]
MVVALVFPAVMVTVEEACSSSSAPPPELGSFDTGIPDTYKAPPEPKPEPPPEPTPEAGCMPLDDGGAVVTATELTFGDAGFVSCQSQALPQNLNIDNNTCAPITYTTTLTTGSAYYAVTPATGTIPALSSQTLTINPNPIPQISLTTQDLYEGALSIGTSAPNDPGHIVQLHMTAYGAVIASTQFGQALSFNGVQVGNTATLPFTINNTGNAPAPVSLQVASQFFSVADAGTAAFTIGGGQSEIVNVKFSPTAVQPYTDTITTSITQGTPLCSAPPGTIPLSGTGTTGVSVTPASLPFGSVNCGSAAAAQPVTIVNTGPAITYTAKFTTGTSYTLADSVTGNPITPGSAVPLAAGGTAVINVIPNTIPVPASVNPGAFNDTLTITTTAQGDSPHTVQLNESAVGAILTMPGPIMITANGVSVSQPFTVGNTAGNAALSFTLVVQATSPAPTNTFSLNQTSFSVPAGATVSPTLTAIGPNSDAFTQYQGTMTLVPATDGGTVLCAPVPPPTDLSVVN